MKNIAESFINAPEAKVSAVSLMDNVGKKLIESFRTSAEYEIPCRLVHKMFEACAEAHSEKTALIACDSEYPKYRISHITNDSEAQFIITTQPHAQNYPAEKVLLIDELLSGNDKGNHDVEVSPEDLAYMIYTSGSIGKSKGVMLRHSGICNFCTQHPANILYETVKDSVSAMIDITTVPFDLSLKDSRAIVRLFEQTHADAISRKALWSTMARWCIVPAVM